MAGSLIDRIAAALSSRVPRLVEPGTYDWEAAVSLLLRPSASGLELLAIKRTEHEGDPWSGHMALPGGRRDVADRSLWMTAVRETREEIGVDLLDVGRLLGRLDVVTPHTPRIPPIAIAPFVVAVQMDVVAQTSSEVEHAVWLPLEVVIDARHRGSLTPGVVPGREYPTIEYRGHIIWGITYRILGQFEEVLRQVGFSDEGGS